MSGGAVHREPVAVIGDVWTLLWAGSGSMASIVARHGLKIGDPLYAAPRPLGKAPVISVEDSLRTLLRWEKEKVEQLERENRQLRARLPQPSLDKILAKRADTPSVWEGLDEHQTRRLERGE